MTRRQDEDIPSLGLWFRRTIARRGDVELQQHRVDRRRCRVAAREPAISSHHMAPRSVVLS